ncbi:MAG TPA: RagB/SusD family nutrient uptake outer membrane protein [Niabella sp.]|nr:RagB/SusD family nutrient uptake outer membrane protein [Niabella sp.]HOZ95568.1 RagB/SusD family nutrient uptake outer membrane protein [Niabella sp.]HQW13808.1 RagB/SusD family nutrient uptake outer membrane protein [Niabella sp.]HQX19299.1 RagB/SusD family nutrient uptake outer membrane protein [Niabella sp.]HQX41651.1 RagB/SusD family nutrient uptake outer membrane protein [Niabella sp.]
MKRMIIWSMVLAGMFTIGSCKKEYLQLNPPSTQTPENIFATTKNAWAAVNGMHRMLYSQWYSNQATGGQSGNMIYMDVLGEDFVMTANANSWFISEYKWQSNRNDASSMVRFNYGFYYTFIGNANMIIANIDNATGSQTDKDYIKGQALAYRAWSYYQMIQLFAPRYVAGGDNSALGLSLVLAPSTVAIPRNTVEEVYTQINKDLDDALSLLTPITTRASKSQLNSSVVKGIKARVALTQQKWGLAAQMAAEARQGTSLMSTTQYLEGFSDTANPEWIWGVDHRDDQPTYFFSFYAYLGNFSSTNTRGNPKAIFSKLYAQIKSTDIRKQVWDSTGKNTSFPLVAGGTRKPYMTRKFLLVNPGNSNGDLVLMRTAEMYLIEAEALARVGGKDAEARQALFTLANKRDASYTLSTNSGQSLIDEILIQRRVELWAEGFRFYDLKRLNIGLDRTGGNHDNSLAVKMTEAAGTTEWIFLIPKAEIEYSQGIVVQNPLQ